LAEKDDWVVGAGVVLPRSFVWVVTAEGVGKRTSVSEYPTQGRAGSGVRTMKLPPGNNQGLAAALVHLEDTEIVALTDKGKAKRSRLGSTSAFKRDYKGEATVSLAKDEKVASAYAFEMRLEPNGVEVSSG
jgi:DNA gyrase subunit A